MAQLTAQIVSYDDEFKRQISHLLRACGVPVGIVEGRSAEGTAPDLVVVDIRADASSGMAAIERLRASSASLAVFVIAAAPEPELILQAMRAGANEFFPWNAVDGSAAARGTESRSTARSADCGAPRAANAGAKPPCVARVPGAKGGAGTTTVRSTAVSNRAPASGRRSSTSSLVSASRALPRRAPRYGPRRDRKPAPAR